MNKELFSIGCGLSSRTEPLGLVGARPVEQKKGADGGVDGKVFFRDHPDAKAKPQIIIFSVKGGNLKLDDVRALDSVVKTQAAAIGVLISMDEPTAKMKVSDC